MIAAAGLPMSTGGRPKKQPEDKIRTKHVRINDDLADDLSWVLQVLGKSSSSAQLLDPYIRGPIRALYKKHEAAIKALKAAQKQAKKSAEADRPEEPS